MTFGLAACIALAATLSCVASARAAGEATLVGISLPLTGADAALGAELRKGAQACLDAAAPAAGSVHLEVLDDAGRPELAVRNLRRFAANPRVVLVLGGGNAEVTSALLPVLAEARLPMLGAATGAASTRRVASPHLFHVRAGDADEAAAIVGQLYELGVQEFVIVHADTALGRDGLEGIRFEMARLTMRPAAVVALPAGGDYGPAIKAVVAAQPPAVVLLAEPEAASRFVQGLSAGGRHMHLIAMSAVAADRLALALGEAARGLAVSQVLPSPWGGKHAVTRAYQAAMRALGETQFSDASMEGCIEARLAREAIKRIKGAVTREAAWAVLDHGSFDLGGYTLRYTPDDRRGSRYVEMTTIGPRGRLIR